MDIDTTQGKDAHQKILDAFRRGDTNVLVGTQMIAKGLDFPNVTLVGVVAADMTLNLSDYRSVERTFQLITQVAGRAGRADVPGRVVVQTYDPEHYGIACAAAQDYDSFYEREMGFREDAGYPPAGGLVAVHMSCPDREHLILAGGYVRRFLEKVIGDAPVSILGPADEPVARIADVWRQVLYLKGSSGASLRKIREWLEKYIEINEGFSSIEITYETTI